MSHTAKFWHKLDDGRIECEVCPRHCKLSDGQRGFCFVRQCQSDKIVLTTYGLSSGLAIDPVEKKPLYHFYPGSKVFSLGTAGCNLSCKFCQNWHISAARDINILSQKASPREIAEYAKNHNCESVAFTYNEPTIFLEYAIDTAKECHKLGIKTIAVTNGYIEKEACAEFYKYIDAANVDLKAFNDATYAKLMGGHLQVVLDTLLYLKHETDVWLEITTLLIPGENDSDAELQAECNWIVENLGVDVPLHFSAFFPAWKMLDKEPTSLKTLQRARNIAKQSGIRHVFLGNIYDPASSHTYCHNCGKIIIERHNYQILSYHLTGDKCEFCGTKCAGIFEE
ncbi:MAG: AmmeMemoRadiSam system radical SAM enzyme [Gammaproteobacteria bacterium]|nr:AmmeMemoRadiSam system radical SAM enzyme [Gammaproteobacteria bacterium]